MGSEIELPSGFKPISLEDYEIFNAYFSKFQPEISEYTFTNLFMWRNYYQFQWIVHNNQLVMVSTNKSGVLTAFPPLGDNLSSSIEFLMDISEKSKLKLEIHRAPKKIAEEIKKLGILCEIIQDRDNWDYIYARNDLVDLPGKPYANFRKKLNRFKRQFVWTYEQLDAHLINLILAMQDEWCGIRACYDDDSLNEENLGIHEIFTHWKTLQFDGGVIKVDGIIIAYTLAEILNNDTIVIHVEKANPEYNGAYQAVAQQFCKNLDEKIIFINREQDLGDPNLRKAKEHYHPVKYIEKYKIEF